MVSLKYLNNFWTTLEIPLIDCEIDIFLTCSAECVIVAELLTTKSQKFQ